MKMGLPEARFRCPLISRVAQDSLDLSAHKRRPERISSEDDGAQIALRAIRESMKVAFNLTLQGKPVGPHDVTAP